MSGVLHGHEDNQDVRELDEFHELFLDEYAMGLRILSRRNDID